MALEDLFRSDSAIKRYRLPPLGSEIDEFSEWLRRQGYCRAVLRFSIWKVSGFNQYLRRRGIKDCREVKNSHAERFIRNQLTDYRRGACSKQSQRQTASSVRHFLKYLSNRRDLSSASPENSQPDQGLLEGYLNYLKCNRNLAQSTIRGYQFYLSPFIDDLGPDAVLDHLSSLSPERVQSLLAKYERTGVRTVNRHMLSALRIFFRYCAQQGYIRHDLAQAIPRVRTYKLSGVPRAVSEEDAKKVLSRIDRTTPKGQRDFAIIQLLYTYGVRGCQVRALKLQDIEWRKGHIRFSGAKGGKEIVEPLTELVGESILQYVRHGRPKAPFPEVFLTTKAPIHPLSKPGVVTALVRQRMSQTEVSGPIRGSHAYRHAFATRMLTKGQSLKTIADMLGHLHINTTFIYTKVDLEMLKQLPLEWPKEVS